MKIIICGINGKMGKVLYNLATEAGHEVVCGVDSFTDASSFKCPVYPFFRDVQEKADATIDFSNPASLDDMLDYSLATKTPAVLATTGYSDAQIAKIDNASKETAIFRSANMSLGVNLLLYLCKLTASVVGEKYDIEIIEKHHNQKLDAPSGTALMLADGINKAMENSLNYVYGRHGKTEKRNKCDLGIHAVRGGTIVGEHEVIFTANDETITLSHSAQSKRIFAAGALKAAEFLKDKTNGLYSMEDIFRFD